MGTSSEKEEEIDFIAIFDRIRQFFISIFNWVSYCFFIARKRWPIFLLFTFLGIGLGFWTCSILRPVYIASISLSSKILTNDFCADLIDNLNEIANDGSHELLAKRLKIDVSIAKEIKKIEFSNFNEKLSKMYDDRDTVVLGIPFKIFVYSYSNRIFDSVESAIVNYLENNKYALKRKEIKKQNLESLRSKLSIELIMLDTLKKNISENILPRGTNNGFVFGQPIDPINVYKAGIEMYRNDLSLREELQLIDGIQVVDSFSPREEPDSPKLWKMTAAGVALSLLFAFLIAFRLERKSS